MSKFVFDFGSFWAPFWSLLGCLLGAKLGPKSVKKSTLNCKIALVRFLGDLEAIFGLSWAVLGRSWGRFGRSWGGLGRSWGALGRSWGGLGRSWSLLGALFYCVGCVGDRGSRPSEPREARRAKAEALMIMYFHVVNCLWLLGWFGDVLSCLGSMLLCIFALESFSRCCRSTTGLLCRTYSLQSAMGLLCRTHSSLSVFQLLRWKSFGINGAPRFWGGTAPHLHGGTQAFTWGNAGPRSAFTCGEARVYMGDRSWGVLVRSWVVLGRSWGGLGSLLGGLGSLLGGLGSLLVGLGSLLGGLGRAKTIGFP